MMTATELIKKLELVPLPEEGGYYREIYRSEGIIPDSSLPDHVGDRRYSTFIYYLLTPEEFSALHWVLSDEIFHFYLGDPVEMFQILSDGSSRTVVLGSDISHHQTVQTVVPKGVWQGTRLKEGGKWALLGCTVSPGFEFSDFKIESRDQLIQRYPQYQELIKRYTR